MGNYVEDHTRPITRTVAGKPFCACPGTPHAGGDTADVRVKLGYGELAIIRDALWRRSKGAYPSAEDSNVALITLGVVRWNLTLPDGSARKVTQEEVERLDEDSIDWLKNELLPAVKRDPLPNPSADRSRGGRSDSGGHTRTTKAQPRATST
jgi:hypothetical protein